MGQSKSFNCILFSWGSPMVEILTLRSPHKLLKNLGALCAYAKCSQSSTKDKLNLNFFFPILDTMEWFNKPSQATVPLMLGYGSCNQRGWRRWMSRSWTAWPAWAAAWTAQPPPASPPSLHSRSSGTDICFTRFV